MGQKISDAVKAYAKNPATLALSSSKLGGNPRPAPGAPAKGFAPSKGVTAPVHTPAPLPWDSNYENTIGGINLTKTNALAGLGNEEAGVKQAFGFDDLSNPFSRLKLMQEKFANQQAATTNGMAAQGMLYDGATQTQRATDQHGYDIDYDQTRREYQSALDSIAQRRTGVTDQAANDAGTADFNRAMTALQNRPDPATVAPAAPKDYTDTPGKDSKGNVGVWRTHKDGHKVFIATKG